MPALHIRGGEAPCGKGEDARPGPMVRGAAVLRAGAGRQPSGGRQSLVPSLSGSLSIGEFRQIPNDGRFAVFFPGLGQPDRVKPVIGGRQSGVGSGEGQHGMPGGGLAGHGAAGAVPVKPDAGGDIGEGVKRQIPRRVVVDVVKDPHQPVFMVVCHGSSSLAQPLCHPLPVQILPSCIRPDPRAYRGGPRKELP